MKPQKLLMDTRPGDQPETTYPYGKNGIQYDLLGTVLNEPGFRALLAQLPYNLIGHISADKKIVIFTTDDTNSAVGTFDPITELYTATLDDNPGHLVNWPNDGSRMGFSLDFYITGQAQRNYKAELVVAFTDKSKFPKYVNCDNPQVQVLDDIRLFPVYTVPIITLTEGVGGSLPGGTYYIAILYEKQDGTTTPWSEVSQGLTIKPGDLASVSDKTVQIAITGADTHYDFIRIAVISKSAGKTTAVQLTDLVPVSNGELNVIYTGDNLTEDVTVTEILTPPAIYNRVGTIGQLNDAMFLGDVDTEPDINDMQQYASIIQVKFVSKLITATAPPPELVNGQMRGMMHEEVYALYARYHKTKGGYTKAFTIPGIPPFGTSLSDSAEAVTGGGASGIPRYQVEDTIPSFDLASKSGTPGIWKNQDENYPDTIEFDSTALGGRNLRNQPVLHHKMPSVRWCKQNLYNSDTDYGRTKLDLLGISVSNITIPAKYVGILDGYEILFAKRTPGNMTVYGQSLMLHTAVSVLDEPLPNANATQYTTGGNWTSEILHQSAGDYDDNWDLQQLRKSTFRFHAFDILLNKPSITPSFVSAQLRLRKQNLRVEGYLEDGADNGDHNMPLVFLIDYTTGNNPASIPAGKYLKSITTGSYLVNGINTGRFINSMHENCWAGMLGGADWPLNNGNSGYRIRGQSYTEAAVGCPDFEETYLVNLISRKENVYTNFYSQPLASMGRYVPLNAFPVFYGGDTFVCDYTFHTYGRHSSTDTAGDGIKGKKAIRRIVCESASNINLRYEIGGNEYSKWYPKTGVSPQNPDACYITRFDRSKDPNQFGYTKDLNALNDFVSSTIFNPFREEITRHPYRVHRGGKLSRQNKPRSWRSFLPLDFYEMQKNTGRIVNLYGQDDQLLIHCENCLYGTQDKGKLQGGSGEVAVTLGAGDIFQFEPLPIVSSPLGFAGTQHDLACIGTPIGYVFPDARQGEIYLYKGQLTNLGPGVNTFLRRYLRVPQNNPYNGNGITIGWDQKYKRILLTVKNFTPVGTIKLFQNTDVFFDALEIGDIINYNGRYIRYQGLNNPMTSGVDCPDDPTPPDTLEWRILAYSCEQDKPLVPAVIPGGFVGLSSPASLLYNGSTGQMYLGDHDDATNGLFTRLDLVMGTRTKIPTAGTITEAYSFLKDPELGKMYAAGKFNGLHTLDTFAETVTNTNYGTDGSNSRTGLWLCGSNVVAWDVTSTTITLIDRVTLNVIATLPIGSITGGATYLNGSFQLYYINSEIWVVPRDGTSQSIAIYAPDFSGTPRTILITGTSPVATGWGNGHYWMNFYYDQVNDKIYLWDIGSTQLYKIDRASEAIDTVTLWYKSPGVNDVEFFYKYDPVADILYVQYYGYDTDPTDIVDKRIYWMNRTSQEVHWAFLDEEIEGDLEREASSDFMWAAVPKLKHWDGGAWATDGYIIKYTHGEEP